MSPVEFEQKMTNGLSKPITAWPANVVTQERELVMRMLSGLRGLRANCLIYCVWKRSNCSPATQTLLDKIVTHNWSKRALWYTVINELSTRNAISLMQSTCFGWKSVNVGVRKAPDLNGEIKTCRCSNLPQVNLKMHGSSYGAFPDCLSLSMKIMKIKCNPFFLKISRYIKE